MISKLQKIIGYCENLVTVFFGLSLCLLLMVGVIVRDYCFVMFDFVCKGITALSKLGLVRGLGFCFFKRIKLSGPVFLAFSI